MRVSLGGLEVEDFREYAQRLPTQGTVHFSVEWVPDHPRPPKVYRPKRLSTAPSALEQCGKCLPNDLLSDVITKLPPAVQQHLHSWPAGGTTGAASSNTETVTATVGPAAVERAPVRPLHGRYTTVPATIGHTAV